MDNSIEEGIAKGPRKLNRKERRGMSGKITPPKAQVTNWTPEDWEKWQKGWKGLYMKAMEMPEHPDIQKGLDRLEEGLYWIDKFHQFLERSANEAETKGKQ